MCLCLFYAHHHCHDLNILNGLVLRCWHRKHRTICQSRCCASCFTGASTRFCGGILDYDRKAHPQHWLPPLLFYSIASQNDSQRSEDVTGPSTDWLLHSVFVRVFVESRDSQQGFEVFAIYGIELRPGPESECGQLVVKVS